MFVGVCSRAASALRRCDRIFVDRNSQAEVSANTITDDNTNTGTNAGYGVRCTIDGFIDGLALSSGNQIVEVPLGKDGDAGFGH